MSCDAKCPAQVRRLLGLGANIEAMDAMGFTALHWAADKGRLNYGVPLAPDTGAWRDVVREAAGTGQ